MCLPSSPPFTKAKYPSKSSRISSGQSTQGGACFENGPLSRMTATRDSRAASRSTTALTKCYNISVHLNDITMSRNAHSGANGDAGDILRLDICTEKHAGDSITYAVAGIWGRRALVPSINDQLSSLNFWWSESIQWQFFIPCNYSFVRFRGSERIEDDAVSVGATESHESPCNSFEL